MLAALLAPLMLAGSDGTSLPFEIELPAGLTAEDLYFRACPEPAPAELEASRTDDRRWLTYGRPEKGRAEFFARFEERLTYRVHVTTRDGLWWGSAASSPAERAAGKPLEVVLVACGRIDAEVVLEGERALTDEEEKATLRPATSQVWLSFQPLDRPGVAPIPMTSLLNESTRFGPLVPGRYRMEVGGQRVLPTSREVVIEKGRATPLVLELEPEPELLDVSFSIVARSGGEDLSFLSVDLLSVTEPRRWFRADQGQGCVVFDAFLSAPHDGEPGGGTIQAVPAGAYYVTTSGTLTGILWPVRARIEAGGPPLELVVLDDPKERGFRMELVEEESGAPIRIAWLRSPDPLFPLPSVARNGALLAPASFAEQAPRDLAFVVTSPGHVPRHATLADFVADERGWTATVALRAGWGLCFRAVAPDGAPLAGVEVLGDGVVLGKTDGHGHADLESPTAPVRFEVRHPRFEYLGGALEYDMRNPPLVLAPRATGR